MSSSTATAGTVCRSLPSAEIVSPHLAPEIELMLCCTRVELDSATQQRMKDLCASSIDWEYLLEASIAHATLPLLYKNLEAINFEQVPIEIVKQLKYLFRSHSVRNSRLAGELVKLLELLHRHRFQAIPLKSFVLAIAAYGNLSLRMFSNLKTLTHKIFSKLERCSCRKDDDFI